MHAGIRDAKVLRMTAGRPETQRWAAIDLLKGYAILCVFVFHARARDNVLFLYGVNIGIHVFVVLFGLNSTLWWRGRVLPRDLRVWYWTRIKRILVPYWASLPVWWAIALWYHPASVSFQWWLPAVQLGGFTLYIATGWFVTMILPLVALFPLLEACARRVGVWPVLLVAMMGELLFAYWRLEIAHSFAWLNSEFVLLSLVAFPPRMLAHVAFGMLLAGRIEKLGAVEGLAATALWVLCAAVQQLALWPQLNPCFETLIGFPATMALLIAFRALPAAPLVTPALLWLGVNSWGLYLGQMLVHNAVSFRCGSLPNLTVNLAACNFPVRGDAEFLSRLYTLVLMSGAIGIVWLSRALVALSGVAGQRLRVEVPPLGRRFRKLHRETHSDQDQSRENSA
jgi:peptidoglycan/LPS O-acetylase OafA/YrhL